MVGDADEGLELTNLHVSTIQMERISCMLLCDTGPERHTYSSLLSSIPPNC